MSGSNQVMELKEREIGMRDKSNPRSLINLLPSYVSTKVEVIPEELLMMGEYDLKRKIKPDVVIERLRIAFWNEYALAQQVGRGMVISNILGGVCSNSTFQSTISNSFKLAYIVTPPVDYQIALEELLHRSLEQLRDIIEMPHVRPNGEPDPRMADVKFKIAQDLINRVRGQVVQRVEVKSQNLNVNAKIEAQAVPQDMDELNRRLAELEGKAKAIDFGGVDVSGRGEEEAEDV